MSLEIKEEFEVRSSRRTYTARTYKLDPKVPEKRCPFHDHLCRIGMDVFYDGSPQPLGRMHIVGIRYYVELEGRIVPTIPGSAQFDIINDFEARETREKEKQT